MIVFVFGRLGFTAKVWILDLSASKTSLAFLSPFPEPTTITWSRGKPPPAPGKGMLLGAKESVDLLGSLI